MMSLCWDLVTFRPDVKFVAKSVTHWGPEGPPLVVQAAGDDQGPEDQTEQGDQTAADNQDSEVGFEQDQQEIVTIPEREELLAPWFNQARREWLESPYTAKPPQQQNLATSTAHRLYNPFLGRKKHIARREARRQEGELKIDEEYKTWLEDIQCWYKGGFAETPTRSYTVELPALHTYRCKMECCYYTTSSGATGT
jgi:hypothetical protein